MTQREQFEDFACQYLDDLRQDGDGNYVDRTAFQWYMVWQAAQQHSEPDKRVTPGIDGARLLSIWEEVMTKRGLAKVLGQKINGEVTVQLDNGDVETYMLSEIEKL